MHNAETGVRRPALKFVAVRAIAPVGGYSTESGYGKIGDTLRHQFHVRVVPIADHARQLQPQRAGFQRPPAWRRLPPPAAEE